MAKNQSKNGKKGKENVEKIREMLGRNDKKRKEIEEETPEIEDEDEETEDEDEELDDEDEETEDEDEDDAPASDDVDASEIGFMSDIKHQLESRGIELTEDIKFILKKKDRVNKKYAHVQTYFGDMPEMDEIGEQFRGGDFIVLIHDGRGYRFSKTFSISVEAYPPLDPATRSAVLQTGMTERDRLNEERNDEMRRELKAQAEEEKKKSADMVALMLQQMNENNKLLITLMTANNQNKGNGMDEFLKMLTAVKALEGSNDKNSFDYNRIFDIVGNAFNNGLNLAQQMISKKDEEGIGDVVTDLVKTFARNINPDTLLAGKGLGVDAQPKQITAGAQGGKATDPKTQTTGKPTAEQIIAVVQEYFQMVRLGFDTEQELDYFIHLATKTRKYALIKAYADKFDNATLLRFVAGAGFGKQFEDEGFKEYVFALLDNVRKYGKLDAETVEDEPEDEDEEYEDDGSEDETDDEDDEELDDETEDDEDEGEDETDDEPEPEPVQPEAGAPVNDKPADPNANNGSNT